MTIIILAILFLLSFFLLKPILLSIILGVILAFIFSPVYNWFFKITKAKNISAAIVSIIFLLLLIIPLWFLTPMLIDQSIKIYIESQKTDFTALITKLFPYFSSSDFSSEIGSITHTFVTRMTNSLMNYFSEILLNLPVIFLQLTIVLFTFFFAVRDKEELVAYVKSLLPFSPEVEKKLFKSSKDITNSVLYGQVFTGIVQGIIIGAGFFIFGVPNAILLTFFAAIAGILPIIGPPLVWIPVVIYLLIDGNTFSAVGVSIFGIISSFSDNLLRPFFVSRKTKLNPAVLLIGMIGGLLLFGVLGFILGPLILAYLIIILEIYRNKKIPGFFIQEKK